MGIKALRAHGKTLSHIKKVEANKSQSFFSNHLTIASYQIKKAAILLAVDSILTHTTERTMEKYVKLTKVLFPDSKIPKQFELGRTKLGCLLHFGLLHTTRRNFSPHYFHLLLITSTYSSL